VNLNSMMVVAGAVLGIIWFWHASMAARERANGAAREACERLRLVMLDGTVSIVRLWFRRDAGGRLRIERTYGFEYSDDGYRRLRGFIVTLGPRVTSVGLAAARSVLGPEDTTPPPVARD
jgi:hypothetical protein